MQPCGTSGFGARCQAQEIEAERGSMENDPENFKHLYFIFSRNDFLVLACFGLFGV